jgi:hypothetical protein
VDAVACLRVSSKAQDHATQCAVTWYPEKQSDRTMARRELGRLRGDPRAKPFVGFTSSVSTA